MNVTSPAIKVEELDAIFAESFGPLALDYAYWEDPSKITLVLQGDASMWPPRKPMPAFCACSEWRSVAHRHWRLTQLAPVPDTELTGRSRAVCERSLTLENVASEVPFSI